MSYIIKCMIVICLWGGLSLSAHSQSSLIPGTTSTEEVVNEDESTPRKTVQYVLASVSGKSAEPLATYFDTRQTSLVKHLNVDELITSFPQIMDKYGEMTPQGLISNSPQGADETGLAKSFERVGSLNVQGAKIPILLERIESKSGEKTWLVSQRTLFALSSLVDGDQITTINRLLPEFLVQNSFRGAPIGQWLGILVLLALCSGLGWLAMMSMHKLANHYREVNEHSRKTQVLNALALPLGILAAIVSLVFLQRYLEFSILIRQDMSVLTLSGIWIAVFIFAWSLIDNLSSRGERILRDKNHVAGLSIVIFFKASAKAILLILALIIVLGSNGVDVTTGLAALGIGGIALALGAQKAIENLVGSIIIIIDQPLRVGDFCRVGDMLGSVEHIGLRSTRIRTREDTLVSFPNGLLSSERIENFSLRRKYLIKTILNLRYETNVSDLKQLLKELREQLNNNLYVSSENLRVRFIAYGAASLDVEVCCYVHAANYEVFLERQENILLDFSSVVERNNSGFAFPSQTVYLARDEKPNAPEKE